MSDLTIIDTPIRMDSQGRYSLNDLHRSAGGEAKHRPGYWLGNQQAIDLIAELETAGITAVATVEGRGGGTYAAKELVYAYAMWISAAFHLRVIRAFDAMVTGGHPAPAFAIPQTLPDALRLAADLAEQRVALVAMVEEQKPKVAALDRISSADGSLCMRDAAKALQIRPIDLRNWLIVNRWIYGRPGHMGWLAYQDRIQQGVMVHKVTTVHREDGTEKLVEQPRITPKGMARIAEGLQKAAA